MARSPNSPSPIFDSLESVRNRLRNKDFTLPATTDLRHTQTDFEYALKFLHSYKGSTATFNSYRRELERLLQWSWYVKKESVLALKREDIEDYLDFCNKPPKAWVGTKQVARFKNKDGKRQANPDWRPFVVSVPKSARKQDPEAQPDPKNHFASQSAVQARYTATSSFFDYLCQETLVQANPVALIRQKSQHIRKHQTTPVIRRITNLQWDL